MCARAPTFFDCLGKAVAIVQSNANFGSITEPKSATNGVMTEEASAAFDTGKFQFRRAGDGMLPLGFWRQAPLHPLGQSEERCPAHAGKRGHETMSVRGLSELARRIGAGVDACRRAMRRCIEFAMIVPIMSACPSARSNSARPSLSTGA